MIITGKPRIKFLWIVMATLPWVAVIFKDKVMGIAFTFSMRKFVENPAALTFLLTLPWYISWVVPPTVNFIADRIWTPVGRRKPFIITSWIGTITSIGLMPLAPNFWWLLAAYMVFSVFNDLGAPVESLKMEIVPPKQRATSAAVMEWIGNIASLTFWVVAIGRFDEMTEMFGLPISGEQGLFWTVSLGMIVMLLFLALGVKETNPHSALLGQPFTFGSVFGGLFSRHLWPVYILAFSVAILGTSLGAFNNFLITEQWGYTKQDQGINIFAGGVINMVLIPLLGLLATKVARSQVYLWLVIAGMTVNTSMYLYYTFILYDARPTIVEMVVFGEMLSVIGVLTRMALTPLVYDFIPRNELGTYAAGSGLVSKGTNILTANLMGVFVWGWATIFLGPPGESVRVTLRKDTPQAQVQMDVTRARWTDPGTGEALVSPKLTARPWYATGAALDHGRGYEIRLKDDESTAIREQRDRLEDERGKYKVRQGYARTRVREIKTQRGIPTTTPAVASTGPATTMASTSPATLPATAPATAPAGEMTIPTPRRYASDLIAQAKMETARIATGAGKDPLQKFEVTVEAEASGEAILASGIKRMDAVLERRAEAFAEQARRVLGDQLMQQGEEVLGAATRPAVIASFPVKSRPDGSVIEKALDRLRLAEPSIVDLRLAPEGAGFALAVSALAPDDPASASKRIEAALLKSAGSGLQAVMAWPPAAASVKQANAVQLDLRIIEDPLDRHPSPITRVVNAIASVAFDPPAKERRLNALGRNLRKEGAVEHASASLVPGDDAAVRLTALMGAGQPPPSDTKLTPPPDAVTQRLGALLGDAPSAAAAGALYATSIPTAKEQRMTIAQPFVIKGFAKQQYDYLVGYIAVFALQVVGLFITLFFLRMVKTGKVRRRGAEEAEAIR